MKISVFALLTLYSFVATLSSNMTFKQIPHNSKTTLLSKNNGYGNWHYKHLLVEYLAEFSAFQRQWFMRSLSFLSLLSTAPTTKQRSEWNLPESRLSVVYFFEVKRLFCKLLILITSCFIKSPFPFVWNNISLSSRKRDYNKWFLKNLEKMCHFLLKQI